MTTLSHACSCVAVRIAEDAATRVCLRGLVEQQAWVGGLTLTQAEELLDWLENHGCTGLEVDCRPGARSAVRCASPSGPEWEREGRLAQGTC